MTTAFIYAAVFLVCFALTEWGKRMFRIPAERTRKWIHIMSCFLVASMSLYLAKEWIYGLAILFMLLLLITRLFGGFSAVQGVRRKTIGEFTLPLGAAWAAWALLPEDVRAFQVGFAVLAISDTLAEYVGKRWPLAAIKFRLIQKSIGGSLAFLVSMLLLLTWCSVLFDVEVNVLKLAAGCTAVALVELSQGFGLDNLFIPIITAWVWQWALV